MDSLVSSFSNEERQFYEKEFSFFNEITGISGKLRPYIKKSKSEKKAPAESVTEIRARSWYVDIKHDAV